jgi:hypothetical protein
VITEGGDAAEEVPKQTKKKEGKRALTKSQGKIT